MTQNTTPEQRADALLGEVEQIIATYGSDRAGWPAGQRERAARLETAAKRALEDIEANDFVAVRARGDEERKRHQAEVRAQMARGDWSNVVRHSANEGIGEVVFQQVFGGSTRTDPWRGIGADAIRTESPTGMRQRAHDVLGVVPGLSDAGRNTLADGIDRDGGGGVAAFVVARSNPCYLSAFDKILRNPERAMYGLTPAEAEAFSAVESIRATLTTNTGTGGYTVPLSLDPNLAALTNTGIANPFRRYARHAVAISSPHRLITSAGITAEWVAEGAAIGASGDHTPTFGKVDVTLFKLAAWVSASYEILEDGVMLEGTLPQLLADARDRAEGTAFATGDGTAAPKGIVTAISATVGSTVTATTRGSFTSASFDDVFSLWGAATPRMRQSPSTVFLANVSQYNIIRKMGGTAGTNPSLFTTDLASGQIPSLFGKPALEASAMSSATTSGTVMVVLANLMDYAIVDSAAGPALEYVPNTFDQASARPNGGRGWIYHQRTGADVLDIAGTRFLKA